MKGECKLGTPSVASAAFGVIFSFTHYSLALNAGGKLPKEYATSLVSAGSNPLTELSGEHCISQSAQPLFPVSTIAIRIRS